MSKDRFKLIPAVYLFLRHKDKILLLKRANTGYQDGKYGVPSGHLEGSELASAAMRREANEEANINIQPEELKLIHVTHRLYDLPELERVDLFFECWKWSGEIKNNEPNKCDELRWFEIKKLPINIIPHIKKVLEKSLNGEYYSEYSSEP